MAHNSRGLIAVIGGESYQVEVGASHYRGQGGLLTKGESQKTDHPVQKYSNTLSRKSYMSSLYIEWPPTNWFRARVWTFGMRWGVDPCCRTWVIIILTVLVWWLPLLNIVLIFFEAVEVFKWEGDFKKWRKGSSERRRMVVNKGSECRNKVKAMMCEQC
jgi:hypothetical protein